MKLHTYKVTLRDVATGQLITQVTTRPCKGSALCKAAGFATFVPTRALIQRARYILGCYAKKPLDQTYQFVSIERVDTMEKPISQIDVESFITDR